MIMIKSLRLQEKKASLRRNTVHLELKKRFFYVCVSISFNHMKLHFQRSKIVGYL